MIECYQHRRAVVLADQCSSQSAIVISAVLVQSQTIYSKDISQQLRLSKAFSWSVMTYTSPNPYTLLLPTSTRALELIMALLRGHSISIRYVHCPYLTPQGDPSHHWAISPSYIYCYIHPKMGFKKLIAMCASLSRPAGSMIYHIDRDYREPGYLVIDVTFVL